MHCALTAQTKKPKLCTECIFASAEIGQPPTDAVCCHHLDTDAVEGSAEKKEILLVLSNTDVGYTHRLVKLTFCKAENLV